MANGGVCFRKVSEIVFGYDRHGSLRVIKDLRFYRRYQEEDYVKRTPRVVLISVGILLAIACLVQILDALSTHMFLANGHIEKNDIGIWILNNWGITGIWVFKIIFTAILLAMMTWWLREGKFFKSRVSQVAYFGIPVILIIYNIYVYIGVIAENFKLAGI